MNQEQTTIWRLLDGRPGHENQVTALSSALARRIRITECDIPVSENLRGLRGLIPGRLQRLAELPAPDLIIGAGHATHLPMLLLRNRFGGRAAVIMRPSLPCRLFDLCLIPHHDPLHFPADCVIRTEGTLNRLQPDCGKDPDAAMILIGGPSRHFHWCHHTVVRQLEHLAAHMPMQLTLATSERTPQDFCRKWQSRNPDIPLMMPEHWTSERLHAELHRSDTVWVTCDSMSMIYESLTAGARVGLIELPARSANRITRNVSRLAEKGLVTLHQHWNPGTPLPRQRHMASEADRCAAIVIERLLRHPDESSVWSRLSRSLRDLRTTGAASGAS